MPTRPETADTTTSAAGCASTRLDYTAAHGDCRVSPQTLSSLQAPCDDLTGYRSRNLALVHVSLRGSLGWRCTLRNRGPLDRSFYRRGGAPRLEAGVRADMVEVARRLLRRNVGVLQALFHGCVMGDFHRVLVDFRPEEPRWPVEGGGSVIVPTNWVKPPAVALFLREIAGQSGTGGSKARRHNRFRLIERLPKAFNRVTADVCVPARAVRIVLCKGRCARTKRCGVENAWSGMDARKREKLEARASSAWRTGLDGHCSAKIVDNNERLEGDLTVTYSFQLDFHPGYARR